MADELKQLLVLLLAVVNLAGFSLMGIDKFKAKHNRWRIKESALFLPAILGGALGSTLGMHLFHHKTKHWYFRFGFPALLVLQIALVIFLWWKSGLSLI